MLDIILGLLLHLALGATPRSAIHAQPARFISPPVVQPMCGPARDPDGGCATQIPVL
jgi:hypothetical protein